MKPGIRLFALGYWFLALTVNLGALTALHVQGGGEEIRLRATTEAVVPLASFSGPAAPVDSDPRFASTVHLDSVVPAVREFRPGSVITFAIHSPALLMRVMTSYKEKLTFFGCAEVFEAAEQSSLD